MDISDAIFAYKQAADCFESEDAIRSGTTILLTKIVSMIVLQEPK